MTNVIEITDLKKSYELPRAERTDDRVVFEAVKGISFTVEKGEIFGILGPNGAGKTTTLEIIEGLKQQSSGTVHVLNLDNRSQSQEIKQQIGVQLQSSEYMASMDLAELLQLFASLYGRSADVDELLSFVNLKDKKHAQVKELSGGQKQRFTLASALVNDPQILFLDEPTTGLDPRARHDVWDLVREINNRGVTIVLTTHYMEEAEFLCNRVAIMDGGTILTINNPRTLIAGLSHTIQISFLVNHELPATMWHGIDDIQKVHGDYPKVILEVKSIDAIAEIIETLKIQKVTFSGFTVRTASLEDVYLELTGRSFGEENT